ncbi:PRP1 splicing factor, N-terminal-domain-containing protein [Boletus edulis]|uniref:PRP1 splicing factor, N-terminal-domain-containing protein n=1 Tax=Boletus edulis BED1 TaxID=1328754 RepID=A0AAD4C8K0_BOLED|nr:PRP1 splicing factor, N-terminal-domain-containing protein [Boletus edulis]KAF8452330.1 PRP1 splicing factor, N-terminal-domain-containing protein [Boletus edulis BED1]
MATKKDNKLAFLSMPAPASYVAGLGRGASGFTTRSDIGPAREGPSAEAIAEAQAKRGEEPDVDSEQFQDPDNEYGLFAGTTYEQDDEEADKIYESVDRNMDSRRRARREVRENVELAQHRAERPKIQQQFADLKRGLSVVTDQEWENIPEVGNLTRKKRRKDERSFVVPDSIIVGDRANTEYESSFDTRESADSGTMTNFVEIGQARDKILSLKLDQISGTSTNSGLATSVDPKGYLTSLDSVVIKSEAEIGDIKRARMLFDSLVKSNPKHAPGWIAAACLEEHAGRMVTARKLIKAGCEQCPKSEDVWLEAARLHNREDAKIILANAVQHVGQSVKVWLAAADLEQDAKAKKRVLRKALENIPNSVRLWKETVNLETSASDARVLLSRAVEVIPLSVELWLALARLETPERAKAVLNKARKSVPTSHEIWIAAGRHLEQEATADPDKPVEARNMELDVVDRTIEAGVRALRRHQVLLTREQWLKEAERCETEGSPRTCEAIIKATVAMEVEEEDRLDTWVADAESAEARGMVGTSRAILAYALKIFPDKRNLWRKAADLEKAHGTRESLDAVLMQAVHYCPQAEVLWLMAAKEKWLAGDVPSAREVLEKAFIANPESEQIWLAAVKLEAENGELGVARELLIRARTVADTERIWMKSAVFERQQGRYDVALETVSTAMTRFPKFPKLYMIQGQIHQLQNNYSAARASYATGMKTCPKDVTLWVLAAKLEELDGKSIKARAILEKGRLVNPANEILWAESIGVEERSGGAAQAKSTLSRGLQECPTSGILWSMAIWAEPRPTRKSRSVDALKKSKDNSIVTCTVARLFWAERKVEKARQWFSRSVATEQDRVQGDHWAWWLKFERQHGTTEHVADVVKHCIAAEPHRGPMWQSVAKDDRNVGKNTKEMLELVAEALH